MSGSLPAIGPGGLLGVSSRDIHELARRRLLVLGLPVTFQARPILTIPPSSSFNLDTGRLSEIQQLLRRQG